VGIRGVAGTGGQTCAPPFWRVFFFFFLEVMSTPKRLEHLQELHKITDTYDLQPSTAHQLSLPSSKLVIQVPQESDTRRQDCSFSSNCLHLATRIHD